MHEFTHITSLVSYTQHATKWRRCHNVYVIHKVYSYDEAILVWRHVLFTDDVVYYVTYSLEGLLDGGLVVGGAGGVEPF